MKDPGPYPVELLKAILDVHGASRISLPGIFSLKPVLFPAIFYDDCEGTEPYTVSGTGDGFQGSYVTEAAFVGLNGLKIQTRETGAAASDYARADLLLPLGPGPVIRLQLMFRRPNTTSADFTTLFMLYTDDEVRRLDASIEAHWNAQRLAYLKKTNAEWTMTQVEQWHLERDNNRWHKLDLAINLLTAQYVHIKLNGKVCAPDPTDLETTGTAGRGRILDFRLKTTAIAAAQAETQFDQILITTEEAP